jgi:hypothetical protein
MRFTQALIELARLQTKEGNYNPVLERKLEIAAGLAGSDKKNDPKSPSKEGDDKVWDLGALRITLLIAGVPSSATAPSVVVDDHHRISEEEEEQITLRCGLVCLYQQTTIEYFHQLSK